MQDDCSTHSERPQSDYVEIQELIELVLAPAKICLDERETWCGRRDLNPYGPFTPFGSSYRLRFSPPGGETFGGSLGGSRGVCGLAILSSSSGRSEA